MLSNYVIVHTVWQHTDLPRDWTRREFAVSKFLDVQDFNKILCYNNFNIIVT